jgi:RNA polymerase nonessential primary-like sigma factor
MQGQRRQMTLFAHLNTDCSKDYEFIETIEPNEHEPEGKNTIDYYLREISKYPLLTKDEELHYAILAQQGDCVARNHILHANLRLVARIARRYIKSGLSLLDLIEEGNMGLMHALEKFDTTLGYRFATYSAWWIQQNIERAIMNQARIVRLPIHIHKQLNQCKRACNALNLDSHQKPSFSKIANYLGKEKEDIENIMFFQDSAISLDVFELHTGKPIEEFLHYDEYQDPLTFLEKQKSLLELQELLKTLSPIEYEVVIRRFGLNSYNAMTLEDISIEFGVTKERVRQVQLRAINSIAKKMQQD